MPPHVKISADERLRIMDNLNDITDSYQPIIDDVGLLMNTFLKVRARVESLYDFADLFGTNKMKSETQRLLRKLVDVYITLSRMYEDLEYSQERSKTLIKTFNVYQSHWKYAE